MKVIVLLLSFVLCGVLSIPCVEVVLTGTGQPNPVPGRAGPGNLLRYGDSSNGCNDVRLQIDVGRGTLIRLADLGLLPVNLTAAFLTHYHSDHNSDLFDLIQTRYLANLGINPGPMKIFASVGNSSDVVRKVMEPYEPDRVHRNMFAPGGFNPKFELNEFQPTSEVTPIWSQGDVVVSTILAVHELDNAAAFRVDTPAGSVVFTGDGRVGPPFNLHKIAAGADIVVVDAFLDHPQITYPPFFRVIHANSTHVGTLGKDLNTPTLVMTHLMPPPGAFGLGLTSNQLDTPVTAEDWESSLRRGGFRNKAVIGNDLDAVKIGLLQVTGFTLVNAQTGEDIGPVNNGDVLHLSQLPRRISIRADIGLGAADIDTVRFEVDGVIASEDNEAPYAIASNNQNGRYRPWRVQEGVHTVTAVAYSDQDGGIFGSPRSITVDIRA